MVPAGLVSIEQINEHYSDHGLLWVTGRHVFVKRLAPTRPNADHESEIRYLRFAICNRAESLAPPSQYAERKEQIEAARKAMRETSE